MKKHFVVATALVGSLALSGCGSSSSGSVESKPAAEPPTSPVASTSTQEASPVVPVNPADIVTITCYDDSHDETGTYKSFEEAWEAPKSSRDSCAASFDWNRRFELTETDEKAVSVAKYDSTGSLDTLYGICASADLGDSDASRPWSEPQIAEAEGALVLCPDHPDKDAVKQRMESGRAENSARERGEIFGSGSYKVGEDIEPGTYVSESSSGLDGCYWERLDADGNIIDNNFMNSGFRAKVTIRASDYSFSSERCGEWRKQ